MSERRWEIGFLIGPCTDEEADEFAEALFDFSGGRLGAVMTQSPYTEDAERPTPESDFSGRRRDDE